MPVMEVVKQQTKKTRIPVDCWSSHGSGSCPVFRGIWSPAWQKSPWRLHRRDPKGI